MAKFKVGDRVRLVSDENDHLGLVRGDVGTVAEESTVPFVDWDRVNDKWAVLENEIEPVAVAPATATLKVEAGRYYKTRDGRKVGPMDGWREGAFREVEGDGRFWHRDGEGQFKANGEDLVAEWVDEPARLKVGDYVVGKSNIGCDVSGPIEVVDDGDTSQPYRVEGLWCYAKDIKLADNPSNKADLSTCVPFPQVGDAVLIPGVVSAINQSPRGTNYNIVFETQNRRVSLHFLEEDFILDEDGDDEDDCPCANNDNGPLPHGGDTAKAFDALGDWLRAVAINPTAAFRSNKEAA